jgi:hypothetical protein
MEDRRADEGGEIASATVVNFATVQKDCCKRLTDVKDLRKPLNKSLIFDKIKKIDWLRPIDTGMVTRQIT